MSSAKTQPARGMRDFLPADVRKREYVIGVIKEVYERYGFEPLETPAVENIETLMGKYGEEGNQLIFKILKRGEHEKSGEADLALRYDLTVPLARVVAQYQNELPKFFKRYQIQPVWRADRPARGRFREFYQCDVDVLGSKSMVVEAELIAAASDALVTLGFSDFVIRVNHRQVLTGLMNAMGVPPEKHADALVALDKLEKVGEETVVRELIQRGIPLNATAGILDLYYRMSKVASGMETVTGVMPLDVKSQMVASVNEQFNRDALNILRTQLGTDELAQRGLDELSSIIELSKASGCGSRIRLDLSLARGLSYYTGSIMEISVSGIGSLGGGGRYDNLVGMFLGKDVPACGFSLGLERIIVVMIEREMFPAHLASAPADVMVAVWNDDSVAEALKLATEIRSRRVRVLFYPEVRKFAKQMFYADKQSIRFRIIVGPDQIQSGTFEVRDKRKGESVMLTRSTIPTTLRKLIEEASDAQHGLAKILESKS